MSQPGELAFNNLMELADMDEELDEACTWRVSLTDLVAEVGFPCKNCGHTMLVHGGVHNSSLMTCQICEMVIIIRKMGLDPHRQHERSEDGLAADPTSGAAQMLAPPPRKGW